MKHSAFALLLLTIVAGAGCGPEPTVARTEVRLALDFTADALLELYVVDESSASCGELLGGLAPDSTEITVHAVERTPANALNGGGSFGAQLDGLPAEVPLAFFARATELGDVVAQDCEANVVVPTNGNVDVTLVVSEF